MTNSENTKTLHRLFSNNQFDEALQMVSNDVEVILYAMGATLNGRDSFLQFMKGFKNAFPDMVLTHRKIFENGDSVATELTAEGTHTGMLVTPNSNVPASGKRIKLNVCEILEWQNGKLKSIHNYQDSLSLMKQTGAV